MRPRPEDQRIVRRAWRSAERLGAPLDVLWVQPSRDLGDEEDRGLRALRRLCALLGAEFHLIESDDVIRVVREFARERGTTYVLVGHPHPARRLERFRDALPDPARARARGHRRAHRRRPGAPRRARCGGGAIVVTAVVLAALAALAVGIAVGWWMPPHGRTGGRLARQGDTRRILLPFSGEAISTRALDAAFRLARAEGRR